MSERSDLYVAFCSTDAASLASQFARAAASRARLFTPSVRVAQVFERELASGESTGRFMIPVPARGQTRGFDRALAERVACAPRSDRRQRRLRWLVLTSEDNAVNADLLRRVAALRPKDDFEPLGTPADRPGAVDRHGPSHTRLQPARARSPVDPSRYAGLIHLGRMRALPEALLEAAGVAMPIVITDTLEARATFDDGAALFIADSSEPAQRAQSLDEKLTQISDLGPADLEIRLMRAYRQVMQRHGPEGFVRAVTAMKAVAS